MKISESIKTIRKAKGLTQKDLADKIDRSLRMIQKYESGDVEPSIEVLNAIAKVLGDDFFDYIEIPNVSILHGSDSVRIAPKNKLTPNLIKEIIESLILNGDINRSVLIHDDLEVLANSIKNFIINEVHTITNKNFMIIEAMENPDKFYEEYMRNED